MCDCVYCDYAHHIFSIIYTKMFALCVSPGIPCIHRINSNFFRKHVLNRIYVIPRNEVINFWYIHVQMFL